MRHGEMFLFKLALLANGKNQNPEPLPLVDLGCRQCLTPTLSRKGGQNTLGGKPILFCFVWAVVKEMKRDKYQQKFFFLLQISKQYRILPAVSVPDLGTEKSSMSVLGEMLHSEKFI